MRNSSLVPEALFDERQSTIAKRPDGRLNLPRAGRVAANMNPLQTASVQTHCVDVRLNASAKRTAADNEDEPLSAGRPNGLVVRPLRWCRNKCELMFLQKRLLA